MNAKYIVVKTDDGQELLFTFPDAISHLWMLEAVENMKHGAPADWQRPYRTVECVGAGFISPDGVCFGGSQLLDMVARHQCDTKLLKNGHQHGDGTLEGGRQHGGLLDNERAA